MFLMRYIFAMSAQDAMRIIAEYAEDQWGMITHAQAAEQGIHRSMLMRLTVHGALEHMAYGVYRVAGAGTRRLSGLYAEWLMLAPKNPAWERSHDQGIVSHQSATSCYEIGDFPAYLHEFTVIKRQRTMREGVRRLSRPDLGEEGVDWEWVADMPVTRPSKTIADLIEDHQDPSLIGGVAADALRKGLITHTELVQAAENFCPYRRQFGNAETVVKWLLGRAEEELRPT